MSHEPGWYTDPTGRFEHRYFDGAVWTEHATTGGEQRTDPLEQGASQADEPATAASESPTTTTPTTGAGEPAGSATPAAAPSGSAPSTPHTSGSPVPPSPDDPPPPTGNVAPSGDPPTKSSPTPAELLIIGGAAVFLLATFLPWYEAVDETGFSLEWSGWSNAWSLFPLVAVMTLLVVGIGVHVVLERFTDVNVPERVPRFRLHELSVVGAAVVAVTTLGYVVRDMSGFDTRVGLILATCASLGMLLGVVLRHRESATADVGGQVPAASAASQKLSAGELTIVAGAAALTIGSFLPVLGILDLELGQTETSGAWGEGLRTLWLVPVLLGLVMAAAILAKFTSVTLPERVLGLRWNQIHLALGIWAAVMLICFLIGDPFMDVVNAVANATGMPAAQVRRGLVQELGALPSIGREPGFWLMLAGALALAVGAIVRDREESKAS